MRGQWGAVVALGAAVAAIAGCGSDVRMVTVTEANPSATRAPASTPMSATTASDRYCQRLDDGTWVTNDSPYSTTACVPEPSQATGDRQADASMALPRCFSCRLADWKRAEERARASSAGHGSDDTRTEAGLEALGTRRFAPASSLSAPETTRTPTTSVSAWPISSPLRSPPHRRTRCWPMTPGPEPPRSAVPHEPSSALNVGDGLTRAGRRSGPPAERSTRANRVSRPSLYRRHRPRTFADVVGQVLRAHRG